MANTSNYTEENIKSLDWREHIRLRPGMYIGKSGDGSSPDDGIYVLLKEVIDNCVDEFVMGEGKIIDIVINDDFVSVRDFGRGIPIGNYFKWDPNEHTKMIQKNYDWKQSTKPFERTYRLMSNLDDRYENGIHDYMKWIKFGYGRCTDHTSKDIRLGYISREQGVELVKKYDHVKAKKSLRYFLELL